MIDSLLWVMQDLYHQPYVLYCGSKVLRYRSAEPILIGGNVTSLDGYILHSFMED